MSLCLLPKARSRTTLKTTMLNPKNLRSQNCTNPQRLNYRIPEISTTATTSAAPPPPPEVLDRAAFCRLCCAFDGFRSLGRPRLQRSVHGRKSGDKVDGVSIELQGSFKGSFRGTIRVCRRGPKLIMVFGSGCVCAWRGLQISYLGLRLRAFVWVQGK